jgi:hypothetical protein
LGRTACGSFGWGGGGCGLVAFGGSTCHRDCLLVV